MSMRKPIKLSWGKKKYDIVITMEVIDRLEDHINLSALVQRCASGDIRLSHASKLIWLLLLEVGAETTDIDDDDEEYQRLISHDDVYEAMHGSGVMSAKNLGLLLREIFGVIFPTPRKKSPTTRTKKSTSKKKAKSTRGKNNMK